MPNFFAPVRQLLVPAMACALLGTTCRALADSSPPLRIDIEVLPTREYADVTIHNDSKEPIVTFQLNCAPLRPFFVSIKLEGESEFRPIGRGPGDITDAEFADRDPRLFPSGGRLGFRITMDRSTGLELKPGAKFLMNLEYGLHDRGGYGLRVENLEGALDEKGYLCLDSGPQTKVTYLAPIKPLWSPEYEKKVIERKLVYREEPTKPNSEPVRPPTEGNAAGHPPRVKLPTPGLPQMKSTPLSSGANAEPTRRLGDGLTGAAESASDGKSSGGASWWIPAGGLALLATVVFGFLRFLKRPTALLCVAGMLFLAQNQNGLAQASAAPGAKANEVERWAKFCAALLRLKDREII